MGLKIDLLDIEAMGRDDLRSAIEKIAHLRGLKVIFEDRAESDALEGKVNAVVSLPPTPSFTPQVAGLDLDSSGLPWDGRIHTDKRSTVADGTWKIKRGVDPAMVKAVLGEQRMTMGGQPAAVFAQPAPVPGIDIPFTPATYPTMSMSVPVTPVAPPFVANVEPPVAPAPIIAPSAGVATSVSPNEQSVTPPLTFEKLLAHLSPAFASGKVTQVSIQQAMQTVGLPSLPMLAHRPELVAQVAQLLGLEL